MGLTPYYEEDGITIYCGDCRDVLPTLPRTQIDLVLTDPPFSIPVKYHDTDGDFPRSWGDLLIMEPFFKGVFQLLRSCIRETGQVYVCCDDDSYPVFLKASFAEWPRSHLIVWYKPTGRRGNGWKHSYELVLHLSTSQTQYPDDFRQDVIGIMPVRTLNRAHPAEKPIDLWSFLRTAHPKAQPLILDPFCGGGSVLRMAKDLALPAIGIEIEERYCAIAVERLRQGVLPLEASA